ncbi:MAG: hypothetical protein AVO35_13360 [Candidatus Aegiribacteria sp. MLS_C]|nr:MAG: hypothetical protein AVO35_13360 [Candidatus Aegiribacteria sp. MLS_C]
MNAGAYARTFTKKPFKDRIKDTGYLIRHSFTIIGRDEDIKTPMIKMGIFTTILRIIFFLSLLTILTIESHENVGLIALTVLLWLIMVAILIPMRFFYDVRQKGNLCWVVYNTLCGKDISYRDAVGHTKSQKGRLKALGLGELVLVYSRTFKKDSGLLINLFLGFLTEVCHFMLPSVVIEEKKLKEIAPDLKSLRENVPATLAGVFGLDFAGDAVKQLLAGLSFLLVLLSIAAGWLLSFVTGAGAVSLFSGAFTISWIPTYITLFFVVLVFGIAGKLVESIKVIYFTVFYTSIKQPRNITEELREDLTHYLTLGGDTEK